MKTVIAAVLSEYIIAEIIGKVNILYAFLVDYTISCGIITVRKYDK